MRILSGEWKGRALRVKPNPSLRPTSDKVRQALGQILREWVKGVKVLDLFSGTGALGLEMLSLGASHVTFVEKEKRHASFIRDNIRLLDAGSRASLVPSDVLVFIQKSNGPYDLILADPPYEKGYAEKLLQAISSSTALRPGGFFVLEASTRENLEAPETLRLHTMRDYGDTRIYLFQKGNHV